MTRRSTASRPQPPAVAHDAEIYTASGYTECSRAYADTMDRYDEVRREGDEEGEARISGELAGLQAAGHMGKHFRCAASADLYALCAPRAPDPD